MSIQESYPQTLEEQRREVEPEQLPTGSVFDAQDELADEVFNQLIDRYEALRKKYGEDAAEQAVEELYHEVA